MIDVCNISVMKPLLAQYGFHFSKAKGQNFLIASWVPERIAEDSGVSPDAGVLEVGPGIGSLTQQLCLRAGKVCAVEVDTRLKPLLAETVGAFSNLEILWADILKQDIPALVREKFPGLRPMACANLPYYITSPVLTALLLFLFVCIVPRAADPAERAGVAVYGLVIAGMLYSALQYRGAYAAWFRLAALLFVFSDSVIAWGRFVAPIPCRTCVVMITYYAAQYLFYLFAVRAATLSDSPH